MRLSLTVALLAAVASVQACGSRGSDGSGGAAGSAGAAGAAGAAGSGGSSGSSGQSGSGGSAGSTNSDTTPPVFAGLTSATATSESRVALAWTAATDETSPGGRIAYRVYAGPAAGQEDFSSPISVSPAGATTLLLSELDPAHDYFLVVRAVDEAGNEDANTAEKSVTTPDSSAPLFAGVTRAEAITSHSMDVEWKPAKDKGTAQADVVYRIYLSDTAGGEDFGNPAMETAPGATTAVLSGLSPLTQYYVVVRAVDSSGNEDTNVFELGDKTGEGVPPTFAGARYAIATGTSIKVYWPPATDNLTEQANIVYDLYESKTSNGQDYSKPTYTTGPADLSYTAKNLAPNTRYYYVVRARDTWANDDGNTLQVNAKTGYDTDTVAPTFAGATSVTGTSPSTLLVTWSAASDDQTPQSELEYDVYVTDTAGAENYSTPTLIAAPGATQATIAGLGPNATRYVVVRARDKAGNVLANTTEKSGATLSASGGDTTAPTWTAGPTASMIAGTPHSLKVSWTAATDDTYGAADIRYHLCIAEQSSDCQGTEFANHIRATSNWGATTLTVGGLLSRTTYFAFVRAEDRDGNMETGEHLAQAKTATSYFDDVQPIWLEKCNSCHSFDPNKVVNVPVGYIDPLWGDQVKLVVPGKPEFSLMYRRINPKDLQTPPFSAAVPNTYSGSQEPRDGSGLSVDPLSGQEDGVIRDWITQGATAN